MSVVVDDAQPSANVLLCMVETASLAGVVRWPDGSSVNRAFVTATASGGPELAAGMDLTEKDGSFVIRGLKPGIYDLEASLFVELGPGRGHEVSRGRASTIATPREGIEITLGAPSR